MLKKIWDHLEEIILLPLISFCVLLIFFQVIMRYVMQNSLSWSEELARYMFVWQLWLGSSYAAKNKTHLRITMIRDRLGDKAQKAVDLLVFVVWIAFAAVVTYKGFELAFTIGSYGQKSTALGLPMMYAYLAVPVGSGLMIIRLIENFVKEHRTAKPKEGEAL